MSSEKILRAVGRSENLEGGQVIIEWAYPIPLVENGLKFVFSEKATKIEEIFTVDLTLTT